MIEFQTAAEMLKTFGLPLDGRTYKRMQERFLRVFGATIQHGKNGGKRHQIMPVHYFDAMDLWFTRELDTPPLPGDDFKNNRIILPEPFARDIERYHPPIELSAVAEWSDAPGQLYFYLWLVWRCYVATKQTPIPLFGQGGVMEHCGAQVTVNIENSGRWLKSGLAVSKPLGPNAPPTYRLTGNIS